MLAKSEIRAKFRRLRDSFVSAARPGSLEASLSDQLVKVCGQGDLWVGYQKTSTEADPAVAISRATTKKWAYPKVEGENLRFFVPQNTQSWVKSSWGILEPDPQKSSEIQIEDASGVLVPGLAFDKKGGRIGSGKGFYDRALKNYRGVKVGLAYSVQITEDELPVEAFDVAMDYVVTEKAVIVVKKGLDHE